MTLHDLNFDSCKSSSFVIEVIKSHDDATVLHNFIIFSSKSSMTKKQSSDWLSKNNQYSYVQVIRS